MAEHILISVQWFQLLQTIAIISSLLFTAYQLKRTIRNERVTHMLAVTQAHRDIWSKVYDHPELSRIRKSAVNLEVNPITEAERLFVSLLILHLSCVLELSAKGLIIPIEGMDEDIRQFFSRPIPQKVWSDISHLQNIRLVQLVENAIKRGELVNAMSSNQETSHAA
jgi:hypothetical protein